MPTSLSQTREPMQDVPAPHWGERIHEFTVEAEASAINETLVQRGVPAANVVAIHYEPAKSMAIGDYTAKYRVLYRA